MIRCLGRIITVICVALGSVHLLAEESPKAFELYDSVYKQFKELRVDESRCANVSNLVIKADVGTVTLQSGTLHFCQPVFGRVCAAVFCGKGLFSMTPPTRVEVEQLERVTSARSVHEEFGAVVILAADSTLSVLAQSLVWTPSNVLAEAEAAIQNARKFYMDDDYDYFQASIIAPILEHQSSTAVYFHFSGTHKQDLFFEIDPLNAEEVQFSRRAYSDAATRDVAELVCQFQTQQEYKKGVNASEHAALVDIEHYTIDFSIDSRLHSTARATMRMMPRFSDRRWLELTMAPNLIVDSMNIAGVKLSWKKTGGTRWILLPTATEKGKNIELTVYYHGDIFLRQVDFIYMKFGSSSWYPTTGETTRSTFDMSFHTSTDYKFQSAGELIESSTKDDILNTHFVIKQPQIHSSFAIGVFKEKVIEDKRIPPVKIWFERDSKQEDMVAQDLLLSFIYFQELFGKPPFESMTAAEINAYHGQAFPGFLHLSFITFISGDNSGFQESFVAHEASHQWWGGAVGWGNYHDQWMSEAFAEYSSMMYMQAVLKNNKQFFERLDKYKKEIVNNRKSVLGSGMEAGPIWLGYRVSSANNSAGDYTKIIYHKGAWILHMLRNMMMDLNTFSDAKFTGMLKEYYETYKGKDPTTEDFKKMVSKHMGQDMSWFFDQWVYGTKVPTYTVSYKTTPQPDGKFKVTMRVKQDGVPPDFRMIVPLKLDFGDNGSASLQTMITGAQAEFDLPLLPMKPEKIDFNIYSSVLCEWEMKSWE